MNEWTSELTTKTVIVIVNSKFRNRYTRLLRKSCVKWEGFPKGFHAWSRSKAKRCQEVERLLSRVMFRTRRTIQGRDESRQELCWNCETSWILKVQHTEKVNTGLMVGYHPRNLLLNYAPIFLLVRSDDFGKCSHLILLYVIEDNNISWRPHNPPDCPI